LGSNKAKTLVFAIIFKG